MFPFLKNKTEKFFFYLTHDREMHPGVPSGGGMEVHPAPVPPSILGHQPPQHQPPAIGGEAGPVPQLVAVGPVGGGAGGRTRGVDTGGEQLKLN